MSARKNQVEKNTKRPISLEIRISKCSEISDIDGALKSIRKTADSKHCSVNDSRSFFTYYCCHSASGLMAIWKMSQIERDREKQGMDFCLRSSDFCLSSSTVIISDDSRCPQTPLKMM